MSRRRAELLCIDDDPQTLSVRKLLLENEGFTVLTADGGREGLEVFKLRRVDAVICDYQMPDMDGGMVAQEIKRLSPNVPVMILSALPYLPEEAPSCIDAFVTKGEPTALLVDKINEMLAGPGARKKAATAWFPSFSRGEGERAPARRARRSFGQQIMGFHGS